MTLCPKCFITIGGLYSTFVGFAQNTHNQISHMQKNILVVVEDQRDSAQITALFEELEQNGSTRFNLMTLPPPNASDKNVDLVIIDLDNITPDNFELMHRLVHGLGITALIVGTSPNHEDSARMLGVEFEFKDWDSKLGFLAKVLECLNLDDHFLRR